MRKNVLKQKLVAGEATVGPFVNFPSPAIVELMGWLGFDFVVIDCEHGSMDYESAENMIRAAELSNITPIVRIGMNVQQHIQRYLEAGAQGVMIPLINNKADAQAVVDAVKYPPVGGRGLFAGRSAMYGVQPIAEYVAEANRETFIALQIETLSGIDHQDEIIDTEHVDVIFLGPGDLSSAFGVHGQMSHPRVVETIESIAEKARARGKHVGTIATDGRQAHYWSECGIKWLMTSTNRLLTSGSKTYLEDCRTQLA